MSFRRSNDPFKNLTRSAQNLGLTDTRESQYQSMGSALKPNRPIEMFLVYTLATVLLFIHTLTGLISAIYYFMIELATQNSEKRLIIAFSVTACFHVFRGLVFLACIPLGCLARVPLFIIASILVLVCLTVDTIMLTLAIVDRAVTSVEMAPYVDIETSMQKFASYICLDLLYIIICVLFILALVRYSKARNLYKRSTLTIS